LRQADAQGYVWNNFVLYNMEAYHSNTGYTRMMDNHNMKFYFKEET